MYKLVYFLLNLITELFKIKSRSRFYEIVGLFVGLGRLLKTSTVLVAVFVLLAVHAILGAIAISLRNVAAAVATAHAPTRRRRLHSWRKVFRLASRIPRERRRLVSRLLLRGAMRAAAAATH